MYDIQGSFNLFHIIEGSGGNFGITIAASEDLLLIGASSAENTLVRQGAVYIFDANDDFKLVKTIWGEEENDYFGSSLAIHSDGRYIIGARNGILQSVCGTSSCSPILHFSNRCNCTNNEYDKSPKSVCCEYYM